MKDPIDLSLILNSVLESGNYTIFIYLVEVLKVDLPDNAIDVVAKYCKMEILKTKIIYFPDDPIYNWIKENRHFDIIEYLLDKGYRPIMTIDILVDVANKVGRTDLINTLCIYSDMNSIDVSPN